jgi:hypothetical protein
MVSKLFAIILPSMESQSGRSPFECWLCSHAFQGFVRSAGATMPRTLRQQLSPGGEVRLCEPLDWSGSQG